MELLTLFLQLAEADGNIPQEGEWKKLVNTSPPQIRGKSKKSKGGIRVVAEFGEEGGFHIFDVTQRQGAY